MVTPSACSYYNIWIPVTKSLTVKLSSIFSITIFGLLLCAYNEAEDTHILNLLDGTDVSVTTC